MVGAVRHQDDPGGAVQFGVGSLGGKLRVLRQGLAFKHALGVGFLRLVTQDQDDLAFDVQAGIVVVAVFRRCNAVAGENDGAFQRPGLGKIERHELGGELQRGGAAVLSELEAVGLAERGVDGDLERLQVALTGGLDAQLAVVVLQPCGGPFQLRAAGATATQLR